MDEVSLARHAWIILDKMWELLGATGRWTPMRNNSLLISTAPALVLGSAARAGTIDFMATGAIVDYTVPQTAEYDIVAFGAQGGAGTNGAGGLGAEIGGEFLLTAGNVLEIA